VAQGELQSLADASERHAAERYLSQQLLAAAIEDAARRADAMVRLDASLRYAVRRPAA
jgi:hypothetical protein